MKRNLIVTIAISFIALGSLAQSSKESEKKDESKSDLLDFSAFEKNTNYETGSFTDSRDGKTYKTVKIGNQTWMAENLVYKAEGGCWAYDNKTDNVPKYGYLYNWDNARISCPAGWHLPSDVEWQELINFSGGNDFAGSKLKETGNSHWSSFNKEAANSYGFTALPGGSVNNSNGEDHVVGEVGFWWSSAEYAFEFAFGVRMDRNGTKASMDVYDMADGFSVRCIKD
jgi:uncharacterized protein (TIGR02145 family)